MSINISQASVKINIASKQGILKWSYVWNKKHVVKFGC